MSRRSRSRRARTLRAAVLGLLTTVGMAACDTPLQAPGPRDASLSSGGAPSLGAVAASFSDWSSAVDIELSSPGAHQAFNTDAVEGCPFISRDGKRFFMASTRPGGEGGIDIWVSTRPSRSDAWGEPVNLGSPVNSEANDFCPTLARDGHTFFFVSTRQVDGSCGGGDIYATRMRDDGSFDEPHNLGCTVNSEDNEFSPFPVPVRGSGPVLYFSSTRPREGAEGGDIYRTESHGGVYEPAELVPGINSLADDGHPNVRRDGLEIFFYSQRTDLPGAQGGPDIYSATRESTSDAWSTPVALGADVNSASSETRPSLSWDGTRLYFGSSRQGSSDIFVTTREPGMNPS